MNGFSSRAVLRCVALAVVTASAVIAGAQDSPRPGDRAYLGVQLMSGQACQAAQPSSTFAVCVIGVRPGGAADRAGLRQGDFILRIGTVIIGDPTALQNVTQSLRPGDDVELEIKRGAETMSKSVRLEMQDAVAAAGPASITSKLSSPLLSPVAALVDPCERTRASGPGPLDPPFRKLQRTVGATELEALLGDRKASITLQGDVLTFAFKAQGET